MPVIPSTTIGNIEDAIEANCGNKPWIICKTPCVAVCITGNKFPANVPMLDIKFCNNCSKFCVGSAIPVNKFCQDAFIALADPCIVELASNAVVPVMPNSVCIT